MKTSHEKNLKILYKKPSQLFKIDIINVINCTNGVTMLDEIKDMVKDSGKNAKEGVKDIVAKRFGGVLPAYIATSWLAFNWSNIALLFMSKASVEQRIQAISGQKDLYWDYLIYPVATGILLSLITPVAEFILKKFTSKFNVGAQRAEEKADLDFSEKLSKKNEEITIRDSRTDELRMESEALHGENLALKNKNDELIKEIRGGYDNIVSIILRAKYLIEKINNAKSLGSLSQNQINELFEKTFTSTEINNAYKRKAALEAQIGPAATNYLLEGKPSPLEANEKLVKELLAVSGVIEIPKDEKKTT